MQIFQHSEEQYEWDIMNDFGQNITDLLLCLILCIFILEEKLPSIFSCTKGKIFCHLLREIGSKALLTLLWNLLANVHSTQQKV